MRLFSTVVLGLVAGGLIGCSKQAASDAPAATGASAAMASAPATGGNIAAEAAGPPREPIAVPATASADQVVTVFLNSLRDGDSATTESLLTSKAREELAKHQLSVDVQSTPNATYQVQPAATPVGNPNGAHVTSVWTEKFDDGDETYEIVWVLRRQQEGWRLAGMAM